MKLSERMLLIANDEDATIGVNVVLSTYADEVIQLEDLIESLRTVARAARRAEEELRHHVDEQNPEDSLGWCLKQLETLDALPQWVLEE